MSINPYESPAAIGTRRSDIPSTVRVDLFPINPAAYTCTCFTQDRFAPMLQTEIITSCQQQGLMPSDSADAGVQVTGKVYAVDEGSQLLRYLLPFIAGATLVHVEGTIQIRGEPARPFRQYLRSRMGAFGGRSDKMLENAMQRIGLVVASEAASRVRPAAEAPSESVARYFGIVMAASLLFAALTAVIGYQWAQGIARTANSIKPGELPGWSVVVGCAAFTAALLFATAFAPTRILRSRSMVWLVAMSGTKTLLKTRVVLFVLGAVAAGVLGLCFLVPQG